MFNVQGKNVVIVGGLNGVGLSLTKTILNKRVNKLFIIDVTENVNLIQELRTGFQTTKINFERIDYTNLKSGEIQNIIQNIVMKMQYVDLFINALETVVEKDLQRTMDINMKLYLNMMMLVRNVMDRNKGGRGGMIVNVLSNLGLQTLKKDFGTGVDVQQYLVNKQMLISLTKAFSDEIFFQQTGVLVMSVVPVINQKMVTKNMDWIKKIGLQNLVIDMNLVGGQNNLYGNQVNNLLGNQNTFYGNQNTLDFDWFNTQQWDDNLFNNQLTGFEGNNFNDDLLTIGGQDLFAIGGQYQDLDLFNNDITQGQRLGGVTGNIRKMVDVLSYNIIRVIERAQNGNIAVVGLGGVKNIQQFGNLSRL